MQNSGFVQALDNEYKQAMNPPPPPVVEANTTLPTPTPVIPDLPKENLVNRLHLDHYFEVFSFGDASQRASI